MRHRKTLLFSKATPGRTPQVEATHDPFPYPSVPRHILKHSVGLGLYFQTLSYFISVMLVVSVLAVYPVYSNISAETRRGYTLITDAGESERCRSGYEVRGRKAQIKSQYLLYEKS
jgi:hypothetical protein